MKKFFLTITIAISLLILPTGIMAQTQLDQIKLTQKFIGTWQEDVSKDSITLWEVQQYNRAFVSILHHIYGEKKSFWFAMNWTIIPKEDKSKGSNVGGDGTYRTWLASFTSENKWNVSFVRDFNPEAILSTVECVFETPKSILFEYFNLKGEKTGEQRFHKIK